MVSNGSEALIGVTTYAERARFGVWDTEAAVLHNSYVDCLGRAGAAPVLLPPSSADPARLLAAVDGVVLAGGADIDPARYGQVPGPGTGAPCPARDRFEFALLHAALAAGRPVLAVCRGMQILNIVLGGTLAQHLPDTVGHTGHAPAPARFGTTTARTVPGSRVAAILGEQALVRCHHHQALATLGDDLAVTATAPDGTVEAVERAGSAFIMGVQWHPEADPGDLRLFQALVDAARTGHAPLAEGAPWT